MKLHHVYLMIGHAWMICAMAIDAFNGNNFSETCSIAVGLFHFLYFGLLRKAGEQVPSRP